MILRPRNGMWVRYKDHTGILIAKNDSDWEVHIVDVEGVTTMVVPANLLVVDQAYYGDIPESRKPDRDLAEKLGYG